MAKKHTEKPKSDKKKANKQIRKPRTNGFLKKDVSTLSIEELKLQYAWSEEGRRKIEVRMFQTGAVHVVNHRGSGSSSLEIGDIEIHQILYQQVVPFAEHRDKVFSELQKRGWRIVYDELKPRWFKPKKVKIKTKDRS